MIHPSPDKNHSDRQGLETIVDSEEIHHWDGANPDHQAQIQQIMRTHSQYGVTAADVQVSRLVYPSTQAQLASVMQEAAHYHWQMLPLGAGSKLDWGGVIGGQKDEGGGMKQEVPPLIGVSTARLNRLIEHAVGDLTVTVEAGMRFAELQATLAEAGQFLAIDPAYPEQATIGGIVATADTGSLRQRYGSVRDMLLGISFVRSDGQIAKAGGRVVKNVAGYDLMKLLTGSYGTLGILTQMTLRVYPLPQASQTVVLSGTAAAIAQVTAATLSSALTPAAIDVLSASVVKQLGMAEPFAVAVRFQSTPAGVQEQTRRLIEVGQALGLTSTIVSDAEDAALWQQLREQMTPAAPDGTITCKIGVRPSEAVSFLQHIDQITVDWLGQIHAASGLGRLVLDASIQPETLLKVRFLCQAKGGFLSILQAPTLLKQQLDVWGYPGNALDLMRKLKQQFDPNTLLSPHRFVGGI